MNGESKKKSQFFPFVSYLSSSLAVSQQCHLKAGKTEALVLHSPPSPLARHQSGRICRGRQGRWNMAAVTDALRENAQTNWLMHDAETYRLQQTSSHADSFTCRGGGGKGKSEACTLSKRVPVLQKSKIIWRCDMKCQQKHDLVLSVALAPSQ